jgi:hypothetical protein
MISLDGQLTGFPADLGLYYQTAAHLPQQAVLTTRATLLDAAAREAIDQAGEDPDEPVEPPGVGVGRLHGVISTSVPSDRSKSS